jgi:hypothetical protein
MRTWLQNRSERWNQQQADRIMRWFNKYVFRFFLVPVRREQESQDK